MIWNAFLGIMEEYSYGYNTRRVKNNLFRLLRNAGEDRGIYSGIRGLAEDGFCELFYLQTHRSATFEFNHQPFHYSIAPSHSERAVELPIAMSFLETWIREGKSVLEVGRVLGSQTLYPHDVIDKYECAAGVINEDIVSFSPAVRYDALVSVSTLEHVGYDEKEKNRAKVGSAIRNIKSRVLAGDGHLFVTMPVGYNPGVEDCIRGAEQLGLSVTCLMRISAMNHWREVSLSTINENLPALSYRSRFSTASAIYILTG